MTTLVNSAPATGTGTVTIAAPVTNSNQTITLPDETGTLYSSATPVRTQKGVPAFSAYQSSAQTIASTTATKILFQSEEFDTTSNYDTTNSRFTPTVAGYYQISVGFNPPSVSRGAEVQLLVYKNGAAIRGLMDTVATATVITVGSCLVYCNGSTDYIEAFIWLQTGGTTIPSQPYDYFQGILIAAA